MNMGQTESRLFSQLEACVTVAEFQEAILHCVEQLGFSDFSLAGHKPSPAEILTTLPYKLRKCYLKNDLIHGDFLLEYTAAKNTPTYLSDVEAFQVNNPFSLERAYRNADYYVLLGSLGYYEGYCIPLQFEGNNHTAMFTLFAKGAKQEDFRGKVGWCRSFLPALLTAITSWWVRNFSALRESETKSIVCNGTKSSEQV